MSVSDHPHHTFRDQGEVMPSLQEVFGFEPYTLSDEWKDAVRALRSRIAAKKRAERRLYGTVSKRRRTAKGTEKSSQGSSSEAAPS